MLFFSRRLKNNIHRTCVSATTKNRGLRRPYNVRAIMNKTIQIYYTAVLGGLGGLLGWWVVGSVQTGAWNVWLAYSLAGLGLGLGIGGCCAATAGRRIQRS